MFDFHQHADGFQEAGRGSKRYIIFLFQPAPQFVFCIVVSEDKDLHVFVNVSCTCSMVMLIWLVLSSEVPQNSPLFILGQLSCPSLSGKCIALHYISVI